MKRLTMKLAVLTIMLVMTVALIPPNAVCALGRCETCTEQCRNESFSIYNQCRTNGGSVSYCDDQMQDYNSTCQSLFCPGCPFLPN